MFLFYLITPLRFFLTDMTFSHSYALPLILLNLSFWLLRETLLWYYEDRVMRKREKKAVAYFWGQTVSLFKVGCHFVASFKHINSNLESLWSWRWKQRTMRHFMSSLGLWGKLGHIHFPATLLGTPVWLHSLPEYSGWLFPSLNGYITHVQPAGFLKVDIS